MTDWKAVILATVPRERRSRVRPEILSAVADHADEMFPRYGFTTIRRQASIIGHMAVESSYFSTFYENLNYRKASALMRAWPRRFRTEASCVGYLGNPIALANKVYNGRMGNRPGTDDGYLNRGTGLLQLTGADMIRAFAEKIGVSIEEARKLLVSPDHALESACVVYLMHVPLRLADAGNVDKETKAINNGYNGLEARKDAIAAATRALAAQSRMRVAARAAEPGGEAEDVNDDGHLEAAPEPVTERDLAAAGSRIVKGGQSAITDLAIKGLTAGTAVAVASDESNEPPRTIGDHLAQATDQIDTIANTVDTATQAVTSAQAMLHWAQAHWHSLALIACIVIFVVFSLRNYGTLRRIIRARIEDSHLGLNIGRS
ncbi:MAG: hypothetical protein ACR65U_08540 [Methylocystis sp.]